MTTKLPLTPDLILIGGIYNIRHRADYEDRGYETDLVLPARHHMVLVIGAIPEKPGYWRVMTVTTVSQDLAISISYRLNSRFTNFVPFAPVLKTPYEMQLELIGGAKFKKASYLRIERSYHVHENGLMEMPERISNRKYGAHMRVVLEGETGMEGLAGVLRWRRDMRRMVERGENVDEAWKADGTERSAPWG